MSVLSKDEFFATLKARMGEDNSDEGIKVLEDFTDTYNDLESKATNSSDDEWKRKYEENDKMWRDKYTARFFDGTSSTGEEVKKEQKEDVIDDGEKITFDDLFDEREG